MTIINYSFCSAGLIMGSSKSKLKDPSQKTKGGDSSILSSTQNLRYGLEGPQESHSTPAKTLGPDENNSSIAPFGGTTELTLFGGVISSNASSPSQRTGQLAG